MTLTKTQLIGAAAFATGIPLWVGAGIMLVESITKRPVTL